MTSKFATNEHRVLILVRALNTGGAERQALVNASRLEKLGYNVDIACFYDSKEGGYVFRNPKISRIILSRKQGAILKCIISFVKLAVKEKYSVIYSFTGMPNIIALLAKIMHKKTVVIWGKRATKLDSNDYGFKYSIEIFLEKLLSKFPDLVISNSRACEVELAQEGFSSGKVITIHNAIDTDIFRPKNVMDGEIQRLPFERSKGMSVIGCVGRLDPMKGHANLISAFFEATKRNPNLRLVIVGNDKKKIKSQLKELVRYLELTDKVYWIEHCDKPENMYQSFDLVTLASDYGEGFPNVLAEAMACGVRCVATDVGDSELIIGDYGEVVPPKNPMALSDAWLRVLDDVSIPSNVLWDYIDSNFSVRLLEKRMRKVMEEMISKDR